MNDTNPTIEKKFQAMLMQKSGIERIRMGSGMFDSARSMMLASFPKDLSPRELRHLLLARTYPEFVSQNADRSMYPGEVDG
jgi:hypothetical protein